MSLIFFRNTYSICMIFAWYLSNSWLHNFACIPFLSSYATHSCTKASETGPFTEHTRLRVRNYTMSALRARMKFVPSIHAEHTHQEPMRTRQELMHLLSVHVRNWCIPWVYTSVLYAYMLSISVQNPRFEKVPSKHVLSVCWSCNSRSTVPLFLKDNM
jgi:hypothetical protein